jgi:hypothetical protein
MTSSNNIWKVRTYKCNTKCHKIGGCISKYSPPEVSSSSDDRGIGTILPSDLLFCSELDILKMKNGIKTRPKHNENIFNLQTNM